MKKKFLIGFLVLIMCIFPVFFSGCGDEEYSATDVDTLYVNMQQDSVTSQFFLNGGNMLVVEFSDNIKTSNPSDKSYIFGQVYKHYLASSSMLFNTVIGRNQTPSFVIQHFKQSEITTIYNNLNDVYAKLKALSESKTVYEETESNIYYRKTLNDYNNLISSLLTLNTNFAKAFFSSSVGKVDYSKADLGNSNIRDMLCYQLMLASKVSFNYELLSFKISNPLGEVSSWYNSSSQIKNFVTLSTACLAIINSPRTDISASTNKNKVASLYLTLQENADKYDNEYNKFYKALESFNAKEYLSLSTQERNIYLENCSALENSSYRIISNFLEGRYSALVNCLDEVTKSISI